METKPKIYTCITAFCDISVRDKQKLKIRGNFCNKEGGLTLNFAPKEKPSNTVHNETINYSQLSEWELFLAKGWTGTVN
jgi:hypothetical protein